MTDLNTIQVLTAEVSSKAAFPLITIGVPFMGAILAGLMAKKDKIRNIVVVLTYLITLGLIFSMYQLVVKGIHLGDHIYQGIEYTIPSILGIKLSLGLDSMGFLFALITGLVWLLASLFATSYMSHEHAKGRFFFFMLLTFSANLAIFMTKDFFSLFVFFELMTLFSYVLVIHEESPAAMAAGQLYIVMSIIGGLLMLVSIILLYFYTGTTAIQPLGALVSERISPAMKYLILVGFIIGFGIKAGMFFLHVWLPQAHPIAPTPASAILSGLIVKVGIYGIIRSIYTLFMPVTIDLQPFMIRLGYILIWAGVVTMFGGMLKAALDKNCKRVLAYSTVSQMGYILLGIGCALYLGEEGAMGLSGSLYHVINHALFKATLFLTIGVIYFYTKELDMDKLGGLGKQFPLTALIYVIAGLSIAGFPMFGGFASKTMLHHALVEAYHHSVHLSALHEPDAWLRFAELIFLITASGTLYYISKMFIKLFLSPAPESLKNSLNPQNKETWAMKAALIPLAMIIIVIGIWPNFLLEHLVGPVLALFGFSSHSHAYHLIFDAHAASGIKSTLPLLYDPKTYSIFNPQVLHNFQSVGTIIIGTMMYWMLDYGTSMFDLSMPREFSLGYWYVRIFNYSLGIFAVIREIFDTIWDKIISLAMVKSLLINQ